MTKKGLYHLAKTGQINNFTGLTSPYEKPEKPDLLINTNLKSIQQSFEAIIEKIEPIIRDQAV
ncbi:adenylyl-sulfate kinase [Deefgea sp. CFH1-16]|uniref:adenylyl-sulfate kinase n=1 Tax=Deefgea sp. CFH1-16 TaxID=2675457 RepID=UPI0019402C29|nr:adenylyl-sulfate kinase [Deefgea sp. CFH1-16]